MRFAFVSVAIAATVSAEDLLVPSDEYPTLLAASLACSSDDRILLAADGPAEALFAEVSNINVLPLGEVTLHFVPGTQMIVERGAEVNIVGVTFTGGPHEVDGELVGVRSEGSMSLHNCDFAATSGTIVRATYPAVVSAVECDVYDCEVPRGSMFDLIYADATLTLCNLHDNSVLETGSIVAGGTLDRCSIYRNANAIAVNGIATVVDCMIFENKAGIVVPESVTGSTIRDNDEAGIFGFVSYPTISDCTVIDNGYAVPWGYQIRASHSVITNCTVIGCRPLWGTDNDTTGSTFAEGNCPVCRRYDLDYDGLVAFPDLIQLLAAWGTPEHDFDGDGLTGLGDLLAMLADWGLCR